MLEYKLHNIFTQEEKIGLITLQGEESLFNELAMSVLLEDEGRYQFFSEKLSIEELDNFNLYPIGALAKELFGCVSARRDDLSLNANPSLKLWER